MPERWRIAGDKYAPLITSLAAKADITLAELRSALAERN